MLTITNRPKGYGSRHALTMPRLSSEAQRVNASRLRCVSKLHSLNLWRRALALQYTIVALSR